MYDMRLSGKEMSVIGVEVSELSASSASLLATVVNKEVAKIVTSFLTVLNINLSNSLSCCSYNT